MICKEIYHNYGIQCFFHHKIMLRDPEVNGVGHDCLIIKTQSRLREHQQNFHHAQRTLAVKGVGEGFSESVKKESL